MLAVALSSTPWRCRLQTVLLFPESAALLLKIARAGEVQLRVEACWALARLVDGTNRAAADAVLKDIFKTVRGLLTDKAVPVQVAAAEVRWSPPSVIGGGGGKDRRPCAKLTLWRLASVWLTYARRRSWCNCDPAPTRWPCRMWRVC